MARVGYHLDILKQPNGEAMSTPTLFAEPEQRNRLLARSTTDRTLAVGPQRFWQVDAAQRSASQPSSRKVFHELVDRIMAASGIALFDAVEAGVPTRMVDVIAGATGETTAYVMDMIGVSQTTFRRKDEAGEPLPDAAGHRVMGYLRVMATLRRLLEESGDPQQLATFDLDTWLATWMRQSLPELGHKTPAEMLRNPEGQRAVEVLLERMRGGLPA